MTKKYTFLSLIAGIFVILGLSVCIYTTALKPTHENPKIQSVLVVTNPGDSAIANLAVAPAGLRVTGEFVGQNEPHVSLSVSDKQPPTLPPIGWGNQTGFNALANPDECTKVLPGQFEDAGLEDCRKWFSLQEEYRKNFSKLFVRKWILSYGELRELYSSSAFHSFSPILQEELEQLRPKIDTLEFRVEPDPSREKTFQFEIEIPWEALPPMESLTLDSLRMVMDFSDKDKEQWDRLPDGFFSRSEALVTLPKKQYTLTPCAYTKDDLVLDTAYQMDDFSLSEHAVVLFIPTQDTDLRELLVIDNPASGYLFEPLDTTYSPIVHSAKFFTKELPDGRILCGPKLAYRDETGIIRSDFVVQENTVDTHPSATGDIRVKHGPFVWFLHFLSGQCGSCARLDMNMYLVDKVSRTIIPQFLYTEVIDDSFIEDIDVHVSDDWNTLSLFTKSFNEDEQKSVWLREDHCFVGEKKQFEVCGKETPVAEPEPRTIMPRDNF